MRYYFVNINIDLNHWQFYWMTFGQNFGYLLLSIKNPSRYLGFALGGFVGLFYCMYSTFRSLNSRDLARNLNVKKISKK